MTASTHTRTGPPQNEGPVIITVHGTKDADRLDDGGRWWQRGSDFSAKLLANLAARGVPGATILPVRWSGANSDFDRFAGSAMLDRTIRQLNRERRPYAIIAHSHGGNVVMEALASVRPSPELAGVVTFGTPFFKRQLKLVPRLIAVFRLAAGLILTPILLWYLANALSSGTDKTIEAIVVFGGLAVACAWMAYSGWRHLLRSRWTRTRLARTIAPDRWLVVHSPRDEAMRLLEAASAMSPAYVTVASARRSLHRFASIAGVVGTLIAFAMTWSYFADPIVTKVSAGRFDLGTAADLTFLLLFPVIYAAIFAAIWLIAHFGGAWLYAKFLSLAIHGGVIGAAFGGDGRFKLTGVTHMPTYLDGATERRLDALNIGGVDEAAVFQSAQRLYDRVVAREGPDGGIGDPDQMWKHLSDALYHNAYMRDDAVIAEVAEHLAARWRAAPLPVSPAQ